MKNTEIYIWLDPVIIGRNKGTGKIYFTYVIAENLSKLNNSELEDHISGHLLQNLMDWADIDQNWDFGIISSKPTNKSESIELALSPEDIVKQENDKKLEQKIKRSVNSKKSITLSKDNFYILDDGLINLKVPNLKIDQNIDFFNIWNALNKHIIGKIKEGDTLLIKDQNGNKIIEILGGSFLNVGLADLKIYNKREKICKSYFDDNGLKGGLYIRDDGRLSIGDADRTFYLDISTSELLKQSLKLGIDLTKLVTDQISIDKK